MTGDFNANTGVDDITKMGKLRSWNYESKVGSCGSLEGASAGELFSPKITESDKVISVFSPEMCRNIEMDYEKSVKVQGIHANMYIGGERTIDK